MYLVRDRNLWLRQPNRSFSTYGRLRLTPAAVSVAVVALKGRAPKIDIHPRLLHGPPGREIAGTRCGAHAGLGARLRLPTDYDAITIL